VHVTELGADYFQYDEVRHELRGERTGIRYQLTDRVTVQVSRVDLDARKIDLRLVTEPGIHTMLKNEARRADGEQGRDKKAKAKTTKAQTVRSTTASRTERSATAKTPRSAKSHLKAGKRKR
jgi:ribonuclease R